MSLGTISYAELIDIFDADDLDAQSGKRSPLHRPDRPRNWTRTSAKDTVFFRPSGDDTYEELARWVIAQAVRDARLTNNYRMALICRRARRFLRVASADLSFWCDRAGLDMTEFLQWSRPRFPRSGDPHAGAMRMRWMARCRRQNPVQFARIRPDLDYPRVNEQDRAVWQSQRPLALRCSRRKWAKAAAGSAAASAA